MRYSCRFYLRKRKVSLPILADLWQYAELFDPLVSLVCTPQNPTDPRGQKHQHTPPSEESGVRGLAGREC